MIDFGGVTLERDCPVPMRDGTVLSADVYRPDGEGPYPVLLQRTPYNKTFAQTGAYAHPVWYARQGYVVVIQDVRGRFASDGVFDPYRNEAADGADTIRWAAGLEGTTGAVGTFGFSYAGIAQLLAAGERPAALACAAIGMAGSDFYDGWTYRGGALQLAFIVSWTFQALAVPDALKRGEPEVAAAAGKIAGDLAAAYRTPLRELLASDLLPPYVADWIRNDARSDFWRDLDPASALDRVAIPCLHVGGWYDIFLAGTIANYSRLCGRIAGQRLLIGPWQHVPWARLNGSVDGGPAADNSVDDLHIAWFDHWLKERPLEEAGSAVRYYEMGSNLWRSSSAWPPAGARALELFLHSGGRANSLSGNGTLSDAPPADESPDIFVYDPAEPVPSIGGSSCCRPDVTPVGAFDQRSNEIRNDVLVYTTDILDRDTHVAGPVAVTLHAATDAPDTDWTAKLVDVHPDGRAINLCDGIVRARFRKGLDAPAPLDDGEVCAYTIDLAATANRFAAGHRIRLEISSSSFPAYDVNDNSGRGGCRAEPFAGRTATQVVFHDRARPSRLKLMVTDAPPPRS